MIFSCAHNETGSKNELGIDSDLADLMAEMESEISPLERQQIDERHSVRNFVDVSLSVTNYVDNVTNEVTDSTILEARIINKSVVTPFDHIEFTVEYLDKDYGLIKELDITLPSEIQPQDTLFFDTIVKRHPSLETLQIIVNTCAGQ